MKGKLFYVLSFLAICTLLSASLTPKKFYEILDTVKSVQPVSKTSEREISEKISAYTVQRDSYGEGGADAAFLPPIAPSETCTEAMQICSGVTVPARTSSGTAEAGPYYGCLSTVPNPTWVYVKIATSGTLSFNVTLAPSADVDFAAWGPFVAPTCGAALSSLKMKACDYNTTNGGTANLGNVLAGEYYMILLTNYSNTAGNISATINGGSTATLECATPGGYGGNLKLWFKANAGTNTTTNGGAISQWTDQGGQGKNVTQATAGNRPLFVTNGINFNPAIDYDGSNDYLLNTTTGITGGDKTYFAVTIANTLPLTTVGIIGAGTTLDETDFGYENGKLNMYENLLGTASGTTAISTAIPILSTGIESSNALSFFNNGAANGSGSYSYSNSTIRFTVGCHSLGSALLPVYKNYWDGYISEVIMYDGALTVTNRERVESYLGIKYGIEVGHNYLSSDGTVIWDKTVNAAYHNNVAGIGRDDLGGLNQRQSKSVNASALVTIGNNNTIVATNQANPNNFSANKSYLIMGDNNGAATWQNTETAILRKRLTREWKIGELGTVGSVKIQIPDNSSVLASKLPAETMTVYLWTDADGDFSSGAIETAMTLSGTNWEANMDFTNGQYFTFATVMPPSPGCVEGATLWLKANNGASPVGGGGGALTSWTDKTAANTFTISGTAPTVVANGFNFNPIVRFGGAGKLVGNVAVDMNEGYAVVSYNGASSLERGTVVSPTTNTTSDGSSRYMFRSASGGIFYTGIMSATTLPATYLTMPVPNSGEIALYSANSANIYRKNGVATGSGSSANGMNGIPQVGDRSLNDSKLNGDLAEVILYGATISATERDKIETYLAVKYGLTLGHNYVSASGTTVFAANGASSTDFDANVFGIGREDCQELHQKQAKSANINGIVTLGLGTIAATNIANTNTLMEDTYLIIGDNNMAAGASALPTGMASACIPPVGMDGIFDRIWKAQETGTVGSTLVSVPTASLTGLGSANPVYLVVADDVALTINVKYLIMTANGANQQVAFDFNGTQYFTFAGSLATETYCAGSHYVRWATQGWAAGALTKTVNLNNGLVMTTTVADSQNILRAGYPRLYQGLPMAYINSNSASKDITWTSQFNQTIASCNFSVYDIDKIQTLFEHVDIKGYKGATVVNPVLTKSLSSYVSISGTVGSGQINNTTTYSPSAKLNVAFNAPIDKVVITYKNNKNTLYPRGAAMLLSDFIIYCPEPVVTPDKIALSKIAPIGNVNHGDTITYTFKFNNADCDDKTVNFTDVLPAGFVWKANTLITPLNGTVNSYGGTNTVSITGITVPPGMSSFTLDAYAGAAIGTHNNQASFVVNGTTYLSDDPFQTGANNATPIILVAPPTTPLLTMVKAVSKDTVVKTDILTFTYTFNNTSGSAIITDFTDEIQPDTVRYKAASLVYGAGQTGTANAYSNVSSLYIENLSIPTGVSTLTVQVEMNGASLGTYQNIATVIPTTASGFRAIEINSNEVAWAIAQGAAFEYAFDCLGSTVQGSFAANGTAGQAGTIKIPINTIHNGTTSFTITGTGFTGNLTTNITANTAFITLPIVYDGSGTEGSRILTISSPDGMGNCSVQVLISVACKAEGGRIGQ